MPSTSNRGELPADQAKRNADNAIRCLDMVVTTSRFELTAMKSCRKNLINGHYAAALDSAKSIDYKGSSALCPNPLIVAIAEIKNAIRYSESK